MGAKRAVVRKADECVRCARPVAVGATGRWDPDTRDVTCLVCLEAAAHSPEDGPDRADRAVIDLTVVDLLRPRSDLEPVTLLPRDVLFTPARTGGVGDPHVASVLADRLADRAVVLHDRRVPRSRRNIDHVAVAASGVWVIDTQRHAGRVERRDVGGFFRTEERLFVGGRDQTRLIDELAWRLGAVVTAVGDDDVPVHGALSLVDADWTLSTEPFRMDDTWISGPGALADLIGATPGPLEPADVDRVAARLSEQLPAA